jgi:hypothetical protein
MTKFCSDIIDAVSPSVPWIHTRCQIEWVPLVSFASASSGIDLFFHNSALARWGLHLQALVAIWEKQDSVCASLSTVSVVW